MRHFLLNPINICILHLLQHLGVFLKRNTSTAWYEFGPPGSDGSYGYEGVSQPPSPIQNLKQALPSRCCLERRSRPTTVLTIQLFTKLSLEPRKMLNVYDDILHNNNNNNNQTTFAGKSELSGLTKTHTTPSQLDFIFSTV